VAALWKTQYFTDALYTASAGVISALTTKSQLQVQAVDTFKNLPPAPTTNKNDVAIVVTVVFKL
jgi:hypothetical protein